MRSCSLQLVSPRTLSPRLTHAAAWVGVPSLLRVSSPLLGACRPWVHPFICRHSGSSRVLAVLNGAARTWACAWLLRDPAFSSLSVSSEVRLPVLGAPCASLSEEPAHCVPQRLPHPCRVPPPTPLTGRAQGCDVLAVSSALRSPGFPSRAAIWTGARGLRSFVNKFSWRLADHGVCAGSGGDRRLGKPLGSAGREGAGSSERPGH